MRHAAILDTPDKDGNTRRPYLEASARQGKPGAAEELEGPGQPAALAYLLGWLDEVYGRSGVGMSGYAPLTYGTIADWSRLTDSHPTPEDVRALFLLDAIRRNPEVAADEPLVTDTPAWPAKKPETADG